MTTMEAKVFTEQQKFKNKVFWWVMIGAMVFSYGLTIPGLFTNEPTDAIVALVITTIIFAAVIGGIAAGTLYTRIDTEGVHYKYGPLHRKWRTIRWVDMKKVYIKKYDAFGEYGGWGIRWGADGWLYNMHGNMGLMVNKKKGTGILLGTQKPEELESVLKNIAPSAFVVDVA